MSSFTDSGPSSDPRRLTNRNTNRYSVNQLYSMAAENDTDIEDDLSRAQKRLRDLKARISAQSKKNFVLERDVRYLDSRIALLIQNRMALDEQNEVQQHLEEIEPNEGAFPPERRLTQYSNLFFLLQSEPRHIASLCRLVSLSEIDTLLQTVMFTLYGNQYESREEHLLLTMFQSVLSAQFETATEFGSLLRANTPVSRMMTTYTRRGPGQSYLKSVLSDRINGLIEHRDLNLEINPLKRKYPDATDYAICSLIGGFFFLRFVNPAVVTPQAFMLVDGVPAKHPRRTLTLIAKMLQNLANKPSYAKEQYMSSLNPFVENNKARINLFLNNLCEVGDFYDTLEMDQYMALSKKDLMIHITLNELYNTHSLITQHISVLAPNDKQHLRILIEELGPAPAQVPRKENRTLDLALFSRWETPIQDITTALMAENNVTQNEILYMETKSIFVQLIRSIPHAADKRPINLSGIAEKAATSRDATLVRKGIKVKEMLRELEELKVVDPKDDYKLMQEEVAAELAHLGNMREKVLQETRSLEAVYKTICDHNNYLRGQLEQYKAYLQNVRFAADKGAAGGVGVLAYGGKERRQPKTAPQGPVRYTHAQLEKEGIIVESNVPDNRRPNIYFNISSPTPGTFIIALHYKGREKAILEMDLKIDDLLEKQKDNKHLLDLEYVQLNVPKVLALLNKIFSKKK
ncbi:glyceraldehyde-3-phosphate dehydrogenase 1 [Serendipita sp. 411]|nr:glyceraldehyde-3-phosphate dehydrogenase 1 [Serendipita sp. 411]